MDSDAVEPSRASASPAANAADDLAEFHRDDLASAAAVVERYQDQRIGVADASLVVLAARYRTRTILTLDRRHFGVVRPQGGERFCILP